MDDDDKKGVRMAGMPLRLAARLVETPGSGAMVYRVAVKQLGLDRLHAFDVPSTVVPFRFRHLGGRGGRDG